MIMDRKTNSNRRFYIVITVAAIVVIAAILVGSTLQTRQTAYDSLANTNKTVINRIDEYSEKTAEEIEETGSVLLRKAYAFRQLLDANGGIVSDEQLKRFVEDQHLYDALLFDKSGKAFMSAHPEGIGFDLNAYDATRYYLDIFKDNSKEIIEIAAVDVDGDGDGGNYNYVAIASTDGKFIIEVIDDANDVENAMARVDVDEVAKGMTCDYSAKTLVLYGDKVVSSNDESLVGKSIEELGIPEEEKGNITFDGSL